jgi:crotonobetainyl-CoA:carnitine CoA-transferase CaiB-like acyl-CoA transferase
MGNRNKRSLALDLSSAEGVAVARRLAAWSDVLIESFRPGVMDRLGLGYQALAAEHPRLVYASLVGYGSTGPGAGRGAFDGAVQAESGMMLATGEEGGPPVKTGPYLIDEASGAALAQAILVALFARERTGRGDRVEVSMLDTALSFQTWEIAEFTLRGEARPRSGNSVTTSVPGDVLRASDGDMFVCAFTDEQWVALCRIIGRHDLADDPDFARFEDRVRNRPAVTEAVSAALATRTRSEWRPLLEAVGIVVGEVRGTPRWWPTRRSRPTAACCACRWARARPPSCARRTRSGASGSRPATRRPLAWASTRWRCYVSWGTSPARSMRCWGPARQP